MKATPGFHETAGPCCCLPESSLGAHPAFPAEVNSLGPGPEFFQVEVDNSLAVGQQVLILWCQSFWSVAELSADLEEQLFLFLLVSLGLIGIVGSIAVFPHAIHEFPQLVDELGQPDISSVPFAQIGVVDLLEVCQVLGDPTQQEVLPTNVVLGCDGFFQSTRAFDWLEGDLVTPFDESLLDCFGQSRECVVLGEPILQG